MRLQNNTPKYRCHFTIRSSEDRRARPGRRKGRDINYFVFGGTPRRLSPSCRRTEMDRRKSRPIATMEAGFLFNGGLDKEGMFPTAPSP